MLVRVHQGVPPLAGNGERVREQCDLHAAARVDASVLGWNAAHIVPAVAALFEVVVTTYGHISMYPSLDPNLDPNRRGQWRTVKDSANFPKETNDL